MGGGRSGRRAVTDGEVVDARVWLAGRPDPVRGGRPGPGVWPVASPAATATGQPHRVPGNGPEGQRLCGVSACVYRKSPALSVP